MFERTVRLPVHAHDAWVWHARPGALERLSPPWDPVRVEAREGPFASEQVTLRVGRLGLKWTARHQEAVPGVRFVDEQVEGPFRSWRHEHRFREHADGTCDLTDRIEYRLPRGAGLADRLLRRRLERLFAWRHRRCRNDLARHARCPDRMRIAITGASGLIGSSLRHFLTTGGHTVVPMVRRDARPGEVPWDPEKGRLAAKDLKGVDAVVHLAGENIDQRWSGDAKRRIRDSRVDGTRLIATTIAAMDRPPVLVCASAVGIYGDRGDEVLDEKSAPGEGFLADVCKDWEAAADPARDAGIRTVHVRNGVVLSPGGGALARMLPPFKAGVAGKMGDGTQWMPWIGIDDTVGMYHHAVTTEVRGAMNAVGPAPITNKEFTDAMGDVLHRPTVLPLPGFGLRALFGGRADEMLLASQRVVPGVARATGYHWDHADIREALGSVLGRPVQATA